jgi:tRNA threonylcarbamoyladenosine biosynthesis protein TsaE
MKILSSSLKETQMLGKIMAQEISKTKRKTSLVICLQGELGSGKTSFAQGFAKGLGIKERVSSPTFIIFRFFKIKKNSGKLYHFDCYRIEKEKEIKELGFKEIVSNPLNIVLIEWPEKIKGMIPPGSLIVKFKLIDEKTRKISVLNFKEEMC